MFQSSSWGAKKLAKVGFEIQRTVKNIGSQSVGSGDGAVCVVISHTSSSHLEYI